MARDSDRSAGGFEIENTGGFLSGFLAEEDEFDRRTVWRLGSWGVASVGAIVLALLANQSSIGLRREQVAAADLLRQSQQLATAARENQNEARRLASAVDTLNGDRDRLYTRVTVLEQGLDSVTGAISRQNTAGPSAAAELPSVLQNPSPAPSVAAVTTTQASTADKPSTDKPPVAVEPGPVNVSSISKDSATAVPLMASKSLLAPPDSAAVKLIEPEVRTKSVVAQAIPEVVAAASLADDIEPDVAAAPKLAVQRTEFGIDVGGANSVAGLRALWRGLLKSEKALAALRPIIVVRESHSGLGMQLRLVAGPLGDAAAAAKICAGLVENDRKCETTVFDGQRLAVRGDEAPPVVTRPAPRKRSVPKRAAVIEEPPPPKKPESTFSAIFSRRTAQ